MSVQHRPGTTAAAGRSAARFLIALAVALVGVVGLAGPASAHHPEITASMDCNGRVSFTARAWSTSDPASRANPDIRVHRSTDGGATYGVLIAQGAFSSSNGYAFSGSFTASVNDTVRLRVKAYANWANGAAPGEPRYVTVTPPTNCTVTSPTAGSIDHTCSSWSVNLDNRASNVAVPYTITVNGTSQTVTVPAGSQVTHTAPVTEDTTYAISVRANNTVLASSTFTVNCVTTAPTAGAIAYDCSTWSVLLDNRASNVAAPYTVTVNGVSQQVLVPAGASQTKTGPVVEDSTNTVTVAANGAVLQSHTFTVNCVTPTPTPTPAPAPGPIEVLPNAAGKAVGTLRVSCQGTVRVTMRNRSDERAVYTVRIAQRKHTVRVAAGRSRTWVTSAAPRQRAQLLLGGKVLASKRLPRACAAPEVLPETGQRG